MIDYGIDLSKPYLILEQDETHVVINGSSRVVQVSAGEFGGNEGTWCIPKEKLLDKVLTKQQKRQLKLIQTTQGTRARQRRKKELLSAIIAEHSNSKSAW